MKVKVSPDICIGCTLCVQIIPEIFRMENDKAVAKEGVVSKEREEKCRQAREDCPVNAIILGG